VTGVMSMIQSIEDIIDPTATTSVGEFSGLVIGFHGPSVACTTAVALLFLAWQRLRA